MLRSEMCEEETVFVEILRGSEPGRTHIDGEPQPSRCQDLESLWIHSPEHVCEGVFPERLS